MQKKIFSSKALLERLKVFFTRNLGLKIVAFVFAILLWAYVLVALNPVRTKSLSDVTITLEGYTDLLSRNLILVNSDLGLADAENGGHLAPGEAHLFLFDLDQARAGDADRKSVV